jgi:hypothetical protein
MRCPHCGFESLKGIRFCLECSHPPTVCCPRCGFESPLPAKLCGACGTPLTGPQATPRPQPSAGHPRPL